jgi:hypothetical protein
VVVCSVWFSQEAVTVSLNSINRLVFLAEALSVSCEVRTGFIYKTEGIKSFKGLSLYEGLSVGLERSGCESYRKRNQHTLLWYDAQMMRL